MRQLHSLHCVIFYQSQPSIEGSHLSQNLIWGEIAIQYCHNGVELA